MKFKLGKKNNEYYAGIYTGRGGVSSLVNFRQSKNLFYVLKVFRFKNMLTGIIGKRKL